MPRKEVIELENFDFPAMVDYGEIRDIDLTKKLPLELFLKHDGYSLQMDKRDFQFVMSNRYPKDTLRIDMSTYMGISAGARHFYAYLLLPAVNVKAESEFGKNAVLCGYGIPSILQKVELYRPVTQYEITHCYKMFEGSKLGDFTPRFSTKEAIIERAKFIAKTYFPGFKLKTK